MRARLPIAIGLVALALGAAGCGDDDEGDTGQAGSTASTPAATAPPATPTATTPVGGRKPIAIAGTEFKFAPANVEVKAGETTFTLRNEGGAPHALEIEGNGVEEETKVIQGGETADLTVNLKPGKYEMYCPVGNHRDMGMEGEVTVS